jgi:PTS system mannose-specific IIB component
MVGIILTSHGEFANGIKQSGEMIFGQQPDVASVVLLPSEGPEQLRAKLQEAISTMSDQEQILIICDLWGGTPFNQSSALLEGHEDTWAIVTGMNLPMLLEAYGMRYASDNAHDIATHICQTGAEGCKTLPESLQPKTAAAAAPEKKAEPAGALPPGTVVGDGKIKYVLARVDTRLLHGQVATGWTKAVNPDRIIVVSDGVAHDDLRKKLIINAAPPGVKVHVVPVDKMIEVAKDGRFGGMKAMLLFETPQDALRAVEGGVDIKEINLGSMAHSQGKVAVNKVLSMDKDDVKTLEALKDKGITFDVRKVPADSKDNLDNLLAKAKAELK